MVKSVKFLRLKFFFNGGLLNVVCFLVFLIRSSSYSVVDVLRIVIIFFERDWIVVSLE